MSRFPLHYQILIAMVLGSILGVLTNPGDVALPDVDVSVTPLDGGYQVVTRDLEGNEIRQEEFADESGFATRYPEISKRYAAADDPSAAYRVSDRKVHFSEVSSGITVNYSRQVEGQPAVTRVQAGDAQELAEKNLQWSELYAEHGGGLAAQVSIWSKFVGDLFLRLLKMITVPLIVTSLVTGVAGLGNTSQFGSMFGKTLLYYFATSMLAITTGLVMVNVVRPGVGAQLPGGGEAVLAGEGESLGGVFLQLVENMIPANPVESLANGDFLSIITFSVLLGIFIIYTGGKSAEFLRDFFQSAFDVMMRMTMFIIRLAPIGVFAFMAYATASQGLDIFMTLAWYMLAVFLALVVHAVIVLPLIVKFVAKRSPLQYAQAMSPALMTAFSTASSNGTLPLTITCVEERAGVPNRVSSFVLPLGATINMDGTALYEAVAVLFIAQAYAFGNPEFQLTLAMQIQVAFTALLASIGAAGIPHAGLVMMAIVLQAVGLPLEAQGIIIAVDRVLDMCRTSVNVWSDSCGCAVLARMEGETGPVA